MVLRHATSKPQNRRPISSDAATTASILILEDDREHKEIVALCPRAGGYENVRTEEYCASALEVIRESSPDLMILDIDLGGMNGLDFLQSLKSDLSLPHFPVLVVTGRKDCERQARELDVAGYLEKPLDVHRLLALVETALGQQDA